MNKTMLCIQMLELLATKEVLSKNEIADLLEINPRNVSEYIKTLIESGYEITSVRGIYGGYHLNKDSIIPAVGLTKEEVQTLKKSCSFLEQQADFLEYKTYLKAISKVLSTSVDAYGTEIKVIDRYPLVMPKEDLLSRYTVFNEAIVSRKKCEINYISSHNKEKVHCIHPYKVFVYSGSWYVLAWNETVNEFGYFRLNRIKEIRITKANFNRLKTYNESDYIDHFGMKQNGQYYDLKLELNDLYTVVSERIYGKNQKITRLDEHRTLLEVSMQNKNMIKTFVLGFGKNVKVLEPAWLKEEIIQEALAMIRENEEKR